ncbi:MAG: hypothetical protein WBD66_07510, partial [Candidatus Acidiferrales bacterium]
MPPAVFSARGRRRGLRLPNIERGYRLPTTDAGVLLPPGTGGRGAAPNKVGPCRPQRTLGDA